MSYGQQKSNAQESRGLMPAQRAYFSNLAPAQYGTVQQLSQAAQADPGGLQYLPMINQLLPVGRYGLPAGTDEGVMQLGRDFFSQASGSRAQRGFTTPGNLEAVLGDAVRMASGQLIPLSTQVALQRAQMGPQLQQLAFGYGTTPLQVLSNLLAGTGESTSSSRGFGFSLGDLSKQGVIGGALSSGLAASDRRLKSHIIKVGIHPLGIGWYEYTIHNHRERGVMADEVQRVMPEAVHIGSDGYLMVDYNMIGRVE